MNASLYGVISEAVRCGEINQIFGARGGSRGFIEEDFIDLKKLKRITHSKSICDKI
jgi:6-phosphofructokinase